MSFPVFRNPVSGLYAIALAGDIPLDDVVSAEPSIEAALEMVESLNAAGAHAPALADQIKRLTARRAA